MTTDVKFTIGLKRSVLASNFSIFADSVFNIKVPSGAGSISLISLSTCRPKKVNPQAACEKSSRFVRRHAPVHRGWRSTQNPRCPVPSLWSCCGAGRLSPSDENSSEMATELRQQSLLVGQIQIKLRIYGNHKELFACSSSRRSSWSCAGILTCKIR